MIMFRYLIAIVLVFIGVSLNLNGSSTAVWDNAGISVGIDNHRVETNKKGIKFGDWNLKPSNHDGIIFGTAREVRSDAWLVQTPFYLAQAAAGLPLSNKSYGLGGQNMVVAYNSPVKQISIIGKPFNWGFLFFSGERAISFYWCFKLIFMILLAFEVCMILTKKNLLLSCLGSFWISFSPLVQWWFMQHLGDLVFFSMAAIVTIHYFFEAKSKVAKSGFALLLCSSVIGFIFVIYPGYQVPLAYFLLFYFLAKLLTAIHRKAMDHIDWIILFFALLLFSVTLMITLGESWSAISATLNTVYPGKRIAVGGGIGLTYFMGILTNFFLPFEKLPPAFQAINACELSSTLNFLLLILVTLPFTIKRDKIKENAFGIYLSLFSLFLVFYASIAGLPKIGQKLTLFSFVEPNRAFQLAMVLGVFASIWYVNYLWETRKIQSKIVLWAGIAVQALFMAFCIQTTIFGEFGKVWLFMLLIVYLGSQMLVIYGKKRCFIVLMALLIAISGMTVNPVSQGLPGIYRKALAVKIKALVKSDKEAKWLADGDNLLYQYPQIFGAKMINGVRFYPDKKLWTLLDPGNQNEEKWNRYAHVKITLSTNKENHFENPSADQLRVKMNSSELNVLKVKYLVTNRELMPLLYENNLNAEMIYGPDKDGNRIYKISKLGLDNMP
ncbi:MAG: hypothetical protein LBV19_00685 [Streptococcaceae bacterium]|jgi:hypothetical protein|nr:hypothetical protein [Streptococcaceae bacterium]